MNDSELCNPNSAIGDLQSEIGNLKSEIPRPLRLLLVEDSEDDAAITLLHLRRGGYDVTCTRVETEPDMRAALASPPPLSPPVGGAGVGEGWDIILSDHAMPHFSSTGALAVYKESGLDIPFLICSGTIGEELAVASMKAGAHDYIMKGNLARLAPAVERELREAQVRRERRQSEARFRALIENATDLTLVLNPDGAGRYVSPSVQRVLGYEPEEMIARGIMDFVHPDDLPAALEAIAYRRQTPGIADRTGEFRVRHANGTWRTLEVIGSNLLDNPAVAGIVVNGRDITERHQAQEQIHRQLETITALYVGAQKLAESLDAARLAQDVTRTCVEVFGAKLAWLGRAEPDGRLTMLHTYGLGSEWAAKIPFRWDNAPQSGSVVGAAVRSRFPAVVTDIANDPRLAAGRPLVLAQGFASIAAFPLISRDQAFGGLALLSDRPDFFSPERVDFFQTYAHQSAAALANAHLYEEMDRHLKQMQALREIDKAITGSLDLSLTLKVFLEQVMGQLHVDAADVLLFNPYLQNLTYAAGRGFRGRGIERTSLRLGQGLAGRAALDRQIVSIPDLAQAGESFKRDPLAGEAFQTYFAAPLVAQGQVKGVLEVFHRTPLSHPVDGMGGWGSQGDDWLSFLEALAGQAAIAIDNAALFRDLQRSNTDLILSYETTLEGWIKFLDLRDKETEGHTERVTVLTERLARAFNLSETERVHLRRGALMHDIGKMGIPDAILLKPGSLTDEEWVIMRKHTTYAFEILSPIVYLRPAIDIPYCHHEKWDGSGYPRRLKGEQIPLPARLFAAVDVWDALINDRPYRAAWPKDKALAHIQAGSGSHFDPRVVEAFLGLQM